MLPKKMKENNWKGYTTTLNLCAKSIPLKEKSFPGDFTLSLSLTCSVPLYVWMNEATQLPWRDGKKI